MRPKSIRFGPFEQSIKKNNNALCRLKARGTEREGNVEKIERVDFMTVTGVAVAVNKFRIVDRSSYLWQRQRQQNESILELEQANAQETTTTHTHTHTRGHICFGLQLMLGVE